MGKQFGSQNWSFSAESKGMEVPARKEISDFCKVRKIEGSNLSRILHISIV